MSIKMIANINCKYEYKNNCKKIIAENNCRNNCKKIIAEIVAEIIANINIKMIANMSIKIIIIIMQ